MRNFEITAGANPDALKAHQMDLEDQLALESLTPRQVATIQKQLAYIAFELTIQDSETHGIPAL